MTAELESCVEPDIDVVTFELDMVGRIRLHTKEVMSVRTLLTGKAHLNTPLMMFTNQIHIYIRSNTHL